MRRRSLLIALPAFGLAGCVTLLPKEAPAQLYRFGGDLAPVPRPAGEPTFAVQTLSLSFAAPASGVHVIGR